MQYAVLLVLASYPDIPFFGFGKNIPGLHLLAAPHQFLTERNDSSFKVDEFRLEPKRRTFLKRRFEGRVNTLGDPKEFFQIFKAAIYRVGFFLELSALPLEFQIFGFRRIQQLIGHDGPRLCDSPEIYQKAARLDIAAALLISYT